MSPPVDLYPHIRPLPPDAPEGPPPNAPAGRWGVEPEEKPECSPEVASLHALEPKLADVRRILFHASRVRCQFRGELKSLAELAQALHHRVIETVLAPPEGQGGPPCDR